VGLQLLLLLPRVAILILLLWYFNPYQDIPWARQFFFTIIVVGIPLSMLVGAGLRLRREKRTFRDLKIMVGDQGMLRRGGGTPALELTRGEIARIEIRANGLRVISRPSSRWIHIHRCLEGYGEIVLRVQQWTDVPQRKQTQLRRLAIYGLFVLLAIGSASAALTVAFSRDVPLLGICLAYVIAVSLFAGVYIGRSSNATTFQKTMSIIAVGGGAAYLLMIFILRYYGWMM
jgi:hypothetical protein